MFVQSIIYIYILQSLAIQNTPKLADQFVVPLKTALRTMSSPEALLVVQGQLEVVIHFLSWHACQQHKPMLKKKLALTTQKTAGIIVIVDCPDSWPEPFQAAPYEDVHAAHA